MVVVEKCKELAPPLEGESQLSLLSTLLLALQTVCLFALLPPAALLSLLWKLIPTRKKSLRDQLVLVTGGGRGLGRGLALGFAKEGCKVAVVDINRGNAEQTAAEIIAAGGVAKAYCVDVASVKEVKQLRSEVGPVDILVNNAGLLNSETLQDFTDDDIRNFVDVNLTGHFWMVREFLPAMRERNSGHIVAISSVAAFAGLFNTAYCATKFGVRGFMESFTFELKSNPKNNIKTTTVFPYFINTSADYMRTWHLRVPAMSVEKAVEDIITGVRKDKELLFVPAFYQFLLPWFQLIPEFSRRLAMRIYSVRISSTSALHAIKTPQ